MIKPHYIYDLDDCPPWHLLIAYGLQWAVIMFPVLVIAADICSLALGLTAAEKVRFLQLTLAASGFFTAFQTLAGHRFPVLEGPATALLLTYVLLAHQGLPVIQGGTILAGTALVAFVLTGTLHRVLHLITPNVVGVILILIAFTLLPHLISPMIGQDSSHLRGDLLTLAIALSLTLLICAGSYWMKGIWQTLAIFLGMALGTVIFALLGRVDPGALSRASWLSLPSSWIPDTPSLSGPAIVSFGFAYVAVLVNSLGSLQGVAGITDEDRLPGALKRGLLCNGLSGVCCGLLGIVGTVSYSSSPGVLLVNRVASRFAVTACGVLLALAAFVPKLASLLAMVPGAVVAAGLCVAMGGQVGAGLAIISADRVISSRDYFIVGIPLILGTLLGFLPTDFLATLPGSVRVVLGNGLISGIVLVLLLEHVLFPMAAPAEEGVQ